MLTLKHFATTLIPAAAFALLTVACASTNSGVAVPPSTIDLHNTGEQSWTTQVGENDAAPVMQNAAALNVADNSRTDVSMMALPRPNARRSNMSLFGGSGGGSRSGLSLFVTQSRFSSTSNSALAGTTATGPIVADFRDASGYGAAFTLGLGSSLGLELGATWVKPKVNFTPASGSTFTGNDVRMIPVTATLQWHLLPGSTIDPYVGAGASYVTFNNSGTFNTNSGLQSVNFSNEVGPLVNAGVNLGFSNSLGILVDAKYMWLHPKGTTTFTGGLPGSVGGGGSFNLNPLLISAGLRFGF